MREVRLSPAGSYDNSARDYAHIKATPMAARDASIIERATAKDWASTYRTIEFDRQDLVKQLKENVTPERSAAIFEAIDAEGRITAMGKAMVIPAAAVVCKKSRLVVMHVS